jgi:hypothetical protein
MFWGGVAVFPLMLLYTFVSYRIFRGKVGEAAGYGTIESPPKATRARGQAGAGRHWCRE